MQRIIRETPPHRASVAGAVRLRTGVSRRNPSEQSRRPSGEPMTAAERSARRSRQPGPGFPRFFAGTPMRGLS